MAEPVVFGLALGGGGARGYAHLGVLEMLEREHLQPAIITGTSFGALVGALYLAFGSAAAVKTRLDAFQRTEEFKALGFEYLKPQERGGCSFLQQVTRVLKNRVVVNLAQSRPGLIHRHKLQEAVKWLLPVKIWENDDTRLGVVATDIRTGEHVYFTDGDLIFAVAASMAIPGFVPPLEFNGRLLVDGGVSQNLPVLLARQMGANLVLAVDVGQAVNPDAPLDNALEVMAQAESITSYHYRNYLAREADLTLKVELKGAHWSEFHRSEEFYLAGKKAYETGALQLQALWERRTHPWRYRIKHLFGGHYQRQRKEIVIES